MNATTAPVRAFQVFSRKRTVLGAECWTKVTVLSITEGVRDPWTGEVVTSVRFRMEDDKNGTSFAALPLDLFVSSWAV